MAVLLAVIDAHDELGRGGSLLSDKSGMLPKHILFTLRYPSLDQDEVGVLDAVEVSWTHALTGRDREK